MTVSLSRSFFNILNMVFIGALLFIFLLQHPVSIFSLTYPRDHHPSHSLLTDKDALLEFKKTIIFDPHSTLSNWDEAVHVCNFTGIKCDKFQHRVTELILAETHLVGLLSPFLSNLTGLHTLDIVDNQLFGNIPPELCSLSRLHRLHLEGNNLHGCIPDSFSQLSRLNVLHIKDNNITGSLSPSLFSNCTLEIVDLSSNFLSGKIPEEIGNCPGLLSLNLYNNQFTGRIPLSLTNLSLVNLDVEYNLLSGELPLEFVSSCPELLYLHLSYNYMVSHDHNTNLDRFFAALRNCSSLEELELAGMGLGGTFSNTVSQVGIKLKSLLLQENQIYGSIPDSVSKLSSLMILNLTSNLLNGTISPEISKLSNLEQLFLSNNHFKTAIPEALGNCLNLGLLDLSHNEFSGGIPESLGKLGRLNSLFLNNNHLTGKVPSTIGQCIGLYRLDLSYNRLSGSIPPELTGLHEIRIFINLSNNQLEGPLPIELSKLEKVQEMDFSSNYLIGNIFPQIASCIAVSMINFSNNFLQGELPESLGELKNLETFDVSQNKLSGLIPKTLGKIDTLSFLNLSYNNLQGMVPSGGIFDSSSNLSFLGNPHLCGTITGKLSCFEKRHWFRNRLFLIIFILVIFIILSMIFCIIGFKCLEVIISSQGTDLAGKPAKRELISNFPRITYQELADATGGFDDQRQVGSGSYGRVYRGVLPDGTPIAVKVLHLKSGNSIKRFNRECQVLKRIRHRNLIRIITACSLPEFKALVLPYMANGSLESRLYASPGSSDLSITQRVNICSDIAEGMAYLHHHSPVKVIHCDLKPSNVLLNDDMTAVVSDFGIARLIMSVGGGNNGFNDNMGSSTANLLCGSIGYIAPEYGFGSNISTKGDVYSFGILVLEMMTRKRPTDDIFSGGLSLHKWVKFHYHGRLEKVIDPVLVTASRDQSHEVKRMQGVAIGELIELGILCTQESPSTRPSMLYVADDLDRLKRYLTGDITRTFASSLGISSSTTDDF
ncbi:putative leucine-rich repeat receptor-like serine/threonine-protein kinase At2g24130 isoform X2 [Prosopis cineraria]|uniref:putative leucine-rich repeat receptor-like serine/threonine-protein kinase At2g24130 isoform X2 n=1 Tax=Prosopis cineraria TaxID=364024 RepID=UPI0024105A1E|nr:putative leucine-rich repeat receptor-like serine/threonine-protein kinase At2g24130 isoform X2 [Prosopis cineraria]